MSEKETNKILHNLSLLHRKDKRVIKEISFHPLLFFKRKAESGDERAIRIMYWGAYVPKEHRVSKEHAMQYIAKVLLENAKDDSERKYIKDALQNKDKPYLDKLYKLYKEKQVI